MKLKIEINGKEVEATREEWEKVCIELQGLFNKPDIVYVPLTQPQPTPPYLYEPWRITYGPQSETGKPLFGLLPITSGIN